MSLANEVSGYLSLLSAIEVELTGGLNQARLGPLTLAPVAQQASPKIVAR